MRIPLALAAVLAAVSMTSAAHASGTTGSGGGFREPQQYDPYEEAYDRGRRVFRRSVTCDECLFADGVRDRDTAIAVIQRVQSGELVLEREQKEALYIYLARRFRLTDNGER